MGHHREPPTDHVTCRYCRKEFKAVTARHLHRIHGYKGKHPILEYKVRFRLDKAICLKTRQKLSAAKEQF
jgi:hypothetical protein